jgi:hypothetical protein
VILLLSVALAGERPVLPGDADAACGVTDLAPGQVFTSPCEAVALSLARSRWYALMVPWADAEHADRLIDASVFKAELAAGVKREAWWEERAKAPLPVPKISPSGWFAIGAGTGAAAVVLGAVAVRWASEVPVTATE